jgi:hypothetical protein
MALRWILRRALPPILIAGLAGCGGQGSADATPIPSTGVPLAAADARGVDVRAGEIAPAHPAMDPLAPHPGGPLDPLAPPPTAPSIPPDPFAPPVSPPPVRPAPTSTGVPL